MNCKETFSRNAARIIDLQSYSCPRFFNCKTYEIYLKLFEPHLKNLNQMQNAADRVGGIDVKIAHVCYI